MAGRKPFVPTPEDRKTVKAMSGYGIPEDEICKVIVNPQTGKAIDAKTLRKHFREELDSAAVIANSRVAQNLFTIATGSGKGAVTAAIFWLKTRAGWKETNKVEMTGADGGPVQIAPPSVSAAELEQIARRLNDEV